MDIEEVKKNVEEAQKALQERTGQLQQSDPVFQNMVGQYNAWKTKLTSLEKPQESSNGQKGSTLHPSHPRGKKKTQGVLQEA